MLHHWSETFVGAREMKKKCSVFMFEEGFLNDEVGLMVVKHMCTVTLVTFFALQCPAPELFPHSDAILMEVEAALGSTEAL